MYDIDLDRIIKDAKIKKSELATHLGVSNATITKVIQGKMSMPASWVDRIKNKLKLDPNDYKIKPLKTIYEVPEGKPLMVFEEVEVYGTANPVLSDYITMKPDAFVTIPMFSSGDAAIHVKGHSMKGYINHGDWIVIKKITNKEAIIYG